MADWGIKVSRTGYDVKTATEDQLLMTSQNNSLKIDAVSLDTVADGGSNDVAHGLSYIPVFLAFGEKPAQSFWTPVAAFPASPYVANGNSYVDGTNVTTSDSNIEAGSMDVRTIIFVDQLE